jgi:FAD:protein FMN transferase
MPFSSTAELPPRAQERVQRMRVSMGTTVVIEGQSATRAAAHVAVGAAFAALEQVAERLHPQGAASDLARLGAAAPGTPVPLWRDTYLVLRFAQQLARASAGVFDPCLPQRSGRIDDIELIDATQPLAIAHAPVLIDCGGLAKGYAVDVAIGVLQRSGCSGGLVNAGGDLRVFGGMARELLLRESAGGFRPLTLTQAALAVSDRDAPRSPGGHRGYYLRGSGVACGARYAAVRARQALCADALTKCVLLCPAPASRALLQQFQAEQLA